MICQSLSIAKAILKRLCFCVAVSRYLDRHPTFLSPPPLACEHWQFFVSRRLLPWVPEVFSLARRTKILRFASAAEGRRHERRNREKNRSLRSSLFRFLSGKRESRKTQGWGNKKISGKVPNFLLSLHPFARHPLGYRFLPLRGNGKDCYAG